MNPTHEVIEKLEGALRASTWSNCLAFVHDALLLASDCYRDDVAAARALARAFPSSAPAGEARLRELATELVNARKAANADWPDRDGIPSAASLDRIDAAFNDLDALLTAAPVPHCDCGAGCAPMQQRAETAEAEVARLTAENAELREDVKVEREMVEGLSKELAGARGTF